MEALEAQARTPPLHTRERNRQKVEAASQERCRKIDGDFSGDTSDINVSYGFMVTK